MTDAKKTVMPAYVVDKAEGASRLADLQKNLRAEREEAALKALPTPCYVVDEAKLLNNLRFCSMCSAKAVRIFCWHRNAFLCSASIR